MWWKGLRIDHTFQTTIQYRHGNSKMMGLQYPLVDSNGLFHSEILSQQLIRYKIWSGNYKDLCKYCKSISIKSYLTRKYKFLDSYLVDLIVSKQDVLLRLSLKLLPNHIWGSAFILWMTTYIAIIKSCLPGLELSFDW